MKSILSHEDLEAFLSAHQAEKALVFKHSTTCPISRAAWEQVEAFENEHPDAPIAMIRVIEERPISLQFAEDIGVQHASPQAIVVENGKAVWNATHYAITQESLSQAFS